MFVKGRTEMPQVSEMIGDFPERHRKFSLHRRSTLGQSGAKECFATMKLDRTSSRELEIDWLIAEEFACDPGFLARFLNLCDLRVDEAYVTGVELQPCLSAGGFGDILVRGIVEGVTFALLIEDKISAGAATDQAARYRAHKRQLEAGGVPVVITALVSPQSYVGEKGQFDAAIALEDLIEIVEAPDETRQAYRRSILQAAIEKKNATGVQAHDPDVHRLRGDYLDLAARICQERQIGLNFPARGAQTYSGDSWISRISHPSLPDGVELRHRLWTTLKARRGQIDLIFRSPDARTKERVEARRPDRLILTPFSRAGIQVSFPFIEIRPDMEITRPMMIDICNAMQMLVDWYRTEIRQAE